MKFIVICAFLVALVAAHPVIESKMGDEDFSVTKLVNHGDCPRYICCCKGWKGTPTYPMPSTDFLTYPVPQVVFTAAKDTCYGFGDLIICDE
ncbi:hypothetical protein MIR68_010529 [Amoeboaphelidium protococcarum]|nr:hypothetical protein MIR68_010529 [Amoeboaphelidium protococcarum]